ncbi:MAG TPA: alanine--glyoxylate aminotransferase family protein [Terriglobales bacterium]
MFRKPRLFTPGPTPLLPAAQFAMAAADMHHRTPEFRALYLKVLDQLKTFIGTKNDVVVLTCSGTGAMEASVANLTNPGDTVLVLAAGKFGERWASLAKAYGLKPNTISAPYGSTFDLAQAKQQLTAETRVVYMQATETSTGVRHNVEAVAKLLKGTDTLLVVDAITGLGTTHIDTDAWGVDLIIGGSQKALMIPPGLAYLAASERAWKRMESSKQPRYYFDLAKERKAASKGEASYTPSVALIAAMGAALDYLASRANGDLAQARVELIDNAERCAAMTRAAAEALGYELFAPDSPGAAVTAVKAPAGKSSTDVVKALKTDFAATVADGQGDMKGQLFRIAHLGFFDYMDTLALVGALEFVTKKVAPKARFELGDGLRAAQNAFASSIEQPELAAAEAR